MFLRATIWFSFDLCPSGSIVFSGVNPHPDLSTRRGEEENPSLNVCLGRSAFIELAFLSDDSPAQGKAPKERADTAMEIKPCSMLLPPNISQQHLPRLGLSLALATDAQRGEPGPDGQLLKGPVCPWCSCLLAGDAPLGRREGGHAWAQQWKSHSEKCGLNEGNGKVKTHWFNTCITIL